MVEYNYEEAVEILEKNLVTAQEQLKVLTNDLNFLKDQITISEVSTLYTAGPHIVDLARLHNYNVTTKK